MKIDETRQQDLGKLLGLVAELNRDEVTVYMCYQGGTGCLLVTVYEGETMGQILLFQGESGRGNTTAS